MTNQERDARTIEIYEEMKNKKATKSLLSRFIAFIRKVLF